MNLDFLSLEFVCCNIIQYEWKRPSFLPIMKIKPDELETTIDTIKVVCVITRKSVFKKKIWLISLELWRLLCDFLNESVFSVDEKNKIKRILKKSIKVP